MLLVEIFIVVGGIVFSAGLLVYFIIIVFDKIDYKRQLQGKRPIRKYKGKITYDSNDEINIELEKDRAAMEYRTKNETFHRI